MNHPLHLVCSTWEMQSVMNHVLVTPQYTVATDGGIMAVVPTQEIFSENFISKIPERKVLIHRKDWKKFYQLGQCEWDTEYKNGINLIDSKGKKDSVKILIETERNLGSTYPMWDKVMPTVFEDQSSIIIDANLLNNLQQALNAPSGVKLAFGKPIILQSIAIQVTPANPDEDHGQYGLIMSVINKH